jgi:hypothetical protein
MALPRRAELSVGPMREAISTMIDMTTRSSTRLKPEDFLPVIETALLEISKFLMG